VAEQELDLLQFSAGGVTQLRARAPQVMRRDGPEPEFGSVLLYDVPYQSFGHALTPALSGSTYATEELASFEFGSRGPCIDGRLNPGGHRYGPDVPAFADQIDNRPVLLSLLQVRETPEQPIPVSADRSQVRPREWRGPAYL
jgi:hypothetical protein